MSVVSMRGQRGASWSLFLSGVAVVAMIVGAGLFYIHQVTTSAAQGYDVVSLERKVDDLKEQEQHLELEAAQLQSLHGIEKSMKRLNFIPTQNVAFTSPMVEGSVAYFGGPTDL